VLQLQLGLPQVVQRSTRLPVQMKQLPEVTRVLSRIHTWPLSWELCQLSCQLDVRGDPGDQLIGATSLLHNVPLVTRDRVLRRSKQIPLARP
jgi:PIN domain nuclease of toxin-antitoxin system